MLPTSCMAVLQDIPQLQFYLHSAQGPHPMSGATLALPVLLSLLLLARPSDQVFFAPNCTATGTHNSLRSAPPEAPLGLTLPTACTTTRTCTQVRPAVLNLR